MIRDNNVLASASVRQAGFHRQLGFVQAWLPPIVKGTFLLPILAGSLPPGRIGMSPRPK